MAFVKKTWKDRLSEFPKRWKLKLLGTSGDTQSVELELDDGTVITQGDRFTAATMNDLEQRIADAFESSVSGVASFNGRVGAVTPSNTDYPSSMIKHTNSDTTETTVESAINGLDVNKVDSSQLRSAGSSGTDFYFDYKNGKYGWNSSSARGAGTFHPFKLPVTDTKTITAKTTTDLGDDHTYRYIDTTGVVNTNSGTYTASSRGAALDMGASNSYRYVNTNSVPNTNSGTYTFPAGDTGGTKDLGETNTYRYVNAQNVYNAGKAQGSCSLTIPQISTEGSNGNADGILKFWLYWPVGRYTILTVGAYYASSDYGYTRDANVQVFNGSSWVTLWSNPKNSTAVSGGTWNVSGYSGLYIQAGAYGQGQWAKFTDIGLS